MHDALVEIMPLYEYRCDACETQFEVLRPRNDPEPVCCPECDEEAEKLFSGFSVGSGSAAAPGLSSSGSGCFPSGGG
jgi:putative FmdB family regulatory protein